MCEDRQPSEYLNRQGSNGQWAGVGKEDEDEEEEEERKEGEEGEEEEDDDKGEE